MLSQSEVRATAVRRSLPGRLVNSVQRRIQEVTGGVTNSNYNPVRVVRKRVGTEQGVQVGGHCFRVRLALQDTERAVHVLLRASSRQLLLLFNGFYMRLTCTLHFP